MHRPLLAAALLLAAAPAWTDEPPAPKLLTCWYDESGQLTGSEPAKSGARAGTTIQTSGNGDRAWSHTILGIDPGLCPDRLPISTLATQ